MGLGTVVASLNLKGERSFSKRFSVPSREDSALFKEGMKSFSLSLSLSLSSYIR
jgi:hypothetical protein